MKIKTHWMVFGGLLLFGGCSSVALLLAQDSAPAAPAAAPTAAPNAGGGRGAGGGGRGPTPTAWAQKPLTAPGWTAPNKPIWKLADILAAHTGKPTWTETVVSDPLLHADYVSMAPGEKTLRHFNADNRDTFIVQDGQIRFTIEGQEPFVASKGYMVDVPYRNIYSMETVGDKPSLRLEITVANSRYDYPSDVTPPAIAGFEFVKVTVAGKGKYENGNVPFLDFNDVIAGKVRANNFVKDDRYVVNILRGRGQSDPGPATNGHFHESSSEFWYIMEGQVRFTIETQPTFIADQGDIVYAPKFMWHLASLAGDGMSTRIPINGYVDLGHHYMAREGGR